MLLRARFGISFFLEGPVLTASVGPAPVDVLGAHFDSSLFLEGVVLTASEGAYSGCSIFPWELGPLWKQFCFEGTVLKALVVCRTSRRLSDFRYPTPGYKKSPGSRPFRARYTNVEPPDEDGLGSGQRPQPVQVIEWGGPCPAMWAR